MSVRYTGTAFCAYSLTLMGACAVLHVGRRRTLTICLTLFISGPFRQAVGVVHAFAICVYLLFRAGALEHNDAYTGSLNRVTRPEATYVKNNIGATSKSMLGETEGVPLMRTTGTNGCEGKHTHTLEGNTLLTNPGRKWFVTHFTVSQTVSQEVCHKLCHKSVSQS